MARLPLIVLFLLLSGCGPSQKEIDEIATLTCNMMGNSRVMDAAYRIEKINEARSEIGIKKYLGSDLVIKQAIALGLCEELVKDPKEFDRLLSQMAAQVENSSPQEAPLAKKQRNRASTKKAPTALDKYRKSALRELQNIEFKLGRGHPNSEKVAMEVGLRSNVGSVSLDLNVHAEGLMARPISCENCSYKIEIRSIWIDFIDSQIFDFSVAREGSPLITFEVGGATKVFHQEIDLPGYADDKIVGLLAKFNGSPDDNSLNIPPEAYRVTLGVIGIHSGTSVMPGETYPFQCEYYPELLNNAGNCDLPNSYFKQIDVRVKL